jgi:hypothetical protein
MATTLRGQDLASFISSKEPELWDKIKGSQIDGKAGDQWLADKENGHNKQNEGRMTNAGGMARAQTVMDLMKQLDSIDMKSDGSGVDINKEKNDAELNRDMYKLLSSNGVPNADAGEAMYQNKLDGLDRMAKATASIDESSKEINTGAPSIPSSQDFKEEYNSRAQKAATQNDNAESTARSGPAAVTQAAKNNEAAFLEQGLTLTNGGIQEVSPDATSRLDDAKTQLSENRDSSTQLFNTIGQLPSAIAEESKPSSERAMNNVITQLASSTEGAEWVGDNVSGNTAKGLSTLSEFNGNHEQVMNRGLQIPGPDSEKYESLMQTLDNPQLMSMLLGDDGKGSDLSASNFKSDDLSKLSELNDWYVVVN